MTWDEHADGWDEDPAVRSYSDAAFASLVQLDHDGRLKLDGAQVLDFGCGTGLLTEKLSQCAKAVVAIDTSVAMIQVLKEKIARRGLDNVTAVAEPIEAAMAADAGLIEASFDVVTCSSVCAFLQDYPAMTRTLSRMLRPGGGFVQWDWELDPASDEPFGLTRSQIEQALNAAGLRDVLIETAFEIEVEGKRMRALLGYGIR
jgi:2-polyprenyl-3-methyl-5-hydroxy-6-metoxy-1,4-benzoquinol methylase